MTANFLFELFKLAPLFLGSVRNLAPIHGEVFTLPVGADLGNWQAQAALRQEAPTSQGNIHLK